MGWFLFALLVHGAPLACCWIVLNRSVPETVSVELLNGNCVDNVDHLTECKPLGYDVELSENEGHAKESSAGLIAIDVRFVSRRLGWRSIHPGRSSVFHNRRIWFG